MDSKKELYEIEFTEDCRDEIREIYKYISNKLIAKESARALMKRMRNTIMGLTENPKLYVKIDKKDRNKMEFRKIVIDNYIILYTINEINKIVYISHMYYTRQNYMDGGLL